MNVYVWVRACVLARRNENHLSKLFETWDISPRRSIEAYWFWVQNIKNQELRVCWPSYFRTVTESMTKILYRCHPSVWCHPDQSLPFESVWIFISTEAHSRCALCCHSRNSFTLVRSCYTCMSHKDSLLTYLLVVSVTGNRVSVAVFLILVILLIIICTSVAYYSLAAIFVKFVFFF